MPTKSQASRDQLLGDLARDLNRERQKWLRQNRSRKSFTRSAILRRLGAEARSASDSSEERRSIACDAVANLRIPRPLTGKTWEDFQDVAIQQEAEHYLAMLTDLAREGRKQALWSLARVAIKLVRELNASAVAHVGAMRTFSEKSPSWPMLIGRRRALGDDPPKT